MKALITSEHVYERTPDGTTWTVGSFPASYWRRYSAIFESVTILARVKEVQEPSPEAQQADDSGVTFVGLPMGGGPVGLILRGLCTAITIKRLRSGDTLTILRVPGTVGSVAATVLAATRSPFVLEVVSDPWEALAPGVTGRWFAPVVRPFVAGSLVLQCRIAAGVAYVTKSSLQRRYPPGSGSITGHYAAVELDDEAFATRQAQKPVRGALRLVTVASLAVRYKRIDLLIKVVAKLARQSHDVSLVVVGDGVVRSELEELASALNISERVRFVGQVASGAAVRRYLWEADVFVLPSRTEGLPSALLEAMAVGLPCVGARVGGVPELLPDEATFPAEDDEALEAILKKLVDQPESLVTMGTHNRAVAREYREEVVDGQRAAFFTSVVTALTSNRFRPERRGTVS